MRALGFFAFAVILGAATMAALSANAADAFTLTIKDHKYDPPEITIPAGVKVKLVVKNEDDTAEEFESVELNREKIVVGNGQIDVFIGPLSSGRYEFFGDFHPETARGHIIVP